MQGWKIFTHALGMVLRNWREALRIALVPTILGAVILILVASVAPPGTTDRPDLGAALAGFAVTMVWLITFIWMLVGWHRFVLLAEYPSGWLPALPRGPIWAYFWRTIQLTIIGLGALLPVAALSIIGGGPVILPLLIWFGAALYAFYRVAPVFPAAAIGQPMGIRAAWSATKPGAGAFVIVIILTLILTQFVSAVDMLVSGSLPYVGTALSIALGAVLGLMNASIFTTIYGHYVEGRALGDTGE